MWHQSRIFTLRRWQFTKIISSSYWYPEVKEIFKKKKKKIKKKFRKKKFKEISKNKFFEQIFFRLEKHFKKVEKFVLGRIGLQFLAAH